MYFCTLVLVEITQVFTASLRNEPLKTRILRKTFKSRLAILQLPNGKFLQRKKIRVQCNPPTIKALLNKPIKSDLCFIKYVFIDNLLLSHL
jgi:hypothetical protein